MLRFLLNFFRPVQPVHLGRWGYHWELKLKHQRFYD